MQQYGMRKVSPSLCGVYIFIRRLNANVSSLGLYHLIPAEFNFSAANLLVCTRSINTPLGELCLRQISWIARSLDPNTNDRALLNTFLLAKAKHSA